MLVFATSDKGGTGRTVTSCNVAYRRALQGHNICYVDFDFGSPTAGSVFRLDNVSRGTAEGGLHSYLAGEVPAPQRINIWDKSEREDIRRRPDGAGALVMLPGDLGGGEFASTPQIVEQCTDLLLQLNGEFQTVMVDLSAGRSYAAQIVLTALADPALAAVERRWLVYHRWTRQHIIAAAGLVNGDRGLIHTGVAHGLDAEELRDAIRYVRTAVVNPDSEEMAGLQPPQVAWLHECDNELHALASELKIGRITKLGDVPLDPVLQWREQILTDVDAHSRHIANLATVHAFEELADKLSGHIGWDRL